MLPVKRIAGRIGKPFQFAQSLGQHAGIVGFVDDPVAPVVFFQQRRRQPVVAESAAAFPVDRLGNAARVIAVNDLLQPRNDMGVAMIAQFHHDPAPAHLLGHCAGGAGASE